MIELLAPVGSREALVAAVESGANAVYLAGKMFGARASAPNFSDEELEEAVQFAHLRGVVVHVTVNTLVDNSEIPLLITYLRYLYKIGVDALIVQDVGVFTVAKKVIPNMSLHASTQMTVHNIEGVKLLAGLGFERVVLSRELSLADITDICNNTDIEIEVFIHGALCISYSGQCLMSSMIGGRSGNRGRCAQPCRLPYTLVDQSGHNVLADKDVGEYLLSPRDLNTLEMIPELIRAGVTSFKIEGRMKRPEYVAVAVDTYRRAIDAWIADQENYVVTEGAQKDLAQIFNRDFTTAYLKKNQGRNMMSDRRPNNRGVRIGRVSEYQYQERMATIKLDEPLYINDIIEFWVKVGGRVSTTISTMMVNGQSVTEAPAGVEVTIGVQPVRVNDRVFKVFDAGLMERARSFFAEPNAIRRIAVDVTVQASEGKPLSIRMQDAEGFFGEAETAFIAEKAIKRPLTIETVSKQIDRLGSTIFTLNHLECSIDGEIMVPVSEMNDARRRAVEELEKSRLASYDRAPLSSQRYTIRDFISSSPKAKASNIPALSVSVDTLDKVKCCLASGADLIMFGGESFQHKVITADEYRQAVAMVRQQGKKIILNTPRIVKAWQMKAMKTELSLFQELQPDAVSVSNLGVMYAAKELMDIPLHGDYPLNIYNDLSMQFFAQQGVRSVTLSPELNCSQIEAICHQDNVQMECLVHGYLTLMVSEYCMIGSYLGGLETGKCSQACLRGEYKLNDRKNETFPVVTDQYCRMHILNGKELSMLPHVPKFHTMGIDRIRIEGKKGTVEYVGKITALYKEILRLGEKHPIFVEDNWAAFEPANVTRGHYFRGVL